jgi:hypothetical protein
MVVGVIVLWECWVRREVSWYSKLLKSSPEMHVLWISSIVSSELIVNPRHICCSKEYLCSLIHLINFDSKSTSLRYLICCLPLEIKSK